MVVFDVTQMSYQSSDRVYRAQMVSKVINSAYRACKVNKGKFSVNRAHSVNEGKLEESSVLTELTRSSKKRRRNRCSPSSLGHHRERSVYQVLSATEGFNGILCIHRAQSVNTEDRFWCSIYRVESVNEGFLEG